MIEKDLAVKHFVVANKRIFVLLPSRIINALDLTTLMPIDDNPFKGKYVAMCTDTHNVFAATMEGRIEDHEGRSMETFLA